MFNKLKNKKVNFFGKSVSVFVIAMIAFAGLGSAALVAYLSNSITGNVVVNSPMKLEITGEGCTGNSCELIFYGGESKTLDATTTKLTSGNTGNMLVEIKFLILMEKVLT